jgi:hypothetical protein
MARRKTIGIKKVLTTILPRRVLDRLADEAGLAQRVRKIVSAARRTSFPIDGKGAGCAA